MTNEESRKRPLKERIEDLQGQANRERVWDNQAVKDLIHAYNLRGDTLAHLFKQAVYFRRLWRKEPIDATKLGKLLTFTRKSSYLMIKMRRLFK